MRHSQPDRADYTDGDAHFKAPEPRMSSPPAIEALWTPSSHGGTDTWETKLQP